MPSVASGPRAPIPGPAHPAQLELRSCGSCPRPATPQARRGACAHLRLPCGRSSELQLRVELEKVLRLQREAELEVERRQKLSAQLKAAEKGGKPLPGW